MREWLHSLRLRIRTARQRRQLDQDLRDEMAFHLAMRAEQLKASGTPDADRVARRRCGHTGRILEDLRASWALAPRLGTIAQDGTFALRAMRRRPVFALVVILTLGIGIGISTATFSIVNTALLRPFGFPEPDRLVALQESLGGFGFSTDPFSPADFLDVQRDQRSFEDVAAYVNIALELSGRDTPVLLDAAKVSSGLFRVLGVAPHLGRVFTAEQDRPGSDVAVISWKLWRTRFNQDPGIVGTTVTLDRRPYTVVGVMPAGFGFPLRGPQGNNRPADVWVPIAFTQQQRQNRGDQFNQNVIGRLKRGVTLDQARSELAILTRQINAAYPAGLRGRGFTIRLSATTFRDAVSGQMQRPLVLLLAAVSLVLLVTCTNIATLVLSRTASRTREVVVRTALGSSRGRLLQLLFVEAATLSLAGGTVGIAIARVLVRALPAAVAEKLPAATDVPIDLRVLAFSAGLTMAASVLFAVLPLVSIDRGMSGPALQHGDTRTTPGVRRHRAQATLVVATVVLACVLLAGAGLFIRSFSALMATDAGFDGTGVLTAAVVLPRNGYPQATSVRGFHQALLDSASSLAGVRTAALATDLPLENYERRTFSPDATNLASNEPRNTNLSWVRGPYFTTLGIRLRSGRFFTDIETLEPREVVIVNERLANRFWPGQSAIGKRLRWGLDVPANPNPWLTIVGVVGDVVDGPLGTPPYLHAYEPFSQFPDGVWDFFPGAFGRHAKLAIRTDEDPRVLIPAVREAIIRLDPQLAIQSIAPMSDRMADVVGPRRFSTFTLAAFAAGALLLTAIGLYGVLTFAVGERRREIAVRLALGAEPSAIVRMVVRQGLTLVAIGVAIGVVAAYSAASALDSLLYRTNAHDLLAFAAVPALLIAIGVAACTLPAYRASRVEALTALRAE